jgi:hypothetical protein
MIEIKRKTLFEYVREILVPINAVFVFSNGVVIALDLMAPQGAYLQALGILMAVFVVGLMIAERFAPEQVGRWLDRPAQGLIQVLKTIWMRQRPIWRSPTWLMAILITVTVIFLGQVSKAKAETGGILATHFESFAYVQQHIFDIKTDLKEIKEQLKNVKKETSEDPRKELANLGVKWREDALEDAVQQSDLQVLKLFVESNFVPNDSYAGSAVYYALKKGNEQVINYLVQMELKSKFSSGASYGSGCFGLLYGFDDIGLGLKTTNGKKLLKKVCGGEEEMQYLKEKLNQLERDINNQRSKSEILKTNEQKIKFLHERLSRCMMDDATKMVAITTGSREKYCTEYARRQLESESALPTKKDTDTLGSYKEFWTIIDH